ncbi:hypothetical protein C0J52_16850 [Blattella germanica]|nr:hypothetical protein C0J52_16850 [Blattella germanica]
MEIHSVGLPPSGNLGTVYNCLNQNSRTLDVNDFDKLYCCPLCYEGNMILQSGLCSSEEIDLGDDLQHNINGETFEMCQNQKVVQIGSIVDCDSTVSDFPVSQESVSVHKEGNTQETSETIFPMTFMCRFCDQFCPDLKSSSAHSKYHKDENGFPCVLCEDYFKTEEEVENHFKNHNLEMVKKMSKPKVEIIEKNHNITDAVRLFKCPHCDKIFGTTERLSFHIRFHNRINSFVCERCMKEFTSENLLFRHMNLIHGGTEICKKCGATFMSKVKLNSHICALIKQPFRCKICKKEFQDTTLLKKHTTTHNFILAKPFQCNECDASFTRISKLNEHVENLHCQSIPQVCTMCTFCKMVFPNMEFAMLHVRKHISTVQEDCKLVEEFEVAMLFCCEYCEAVFIYIENLIQHSSQHSGVNPYHCTFCNMLFSDHNQMKYHKRYHFEHENQCNELSLFSVPLLFVCEACEKSFSTWKGLQIHYNIMHNSYVKGNLQNAERKNRKEDETCHLCEDCGESFKKRDDLRRHKLKVHRRQNSFPCEVCGKVLLHYSSLVIHRRQHTGERPFMCDICGKSFPQSPAMYTHRRTHTRDYPYR